MDLQYSGDIKEQKKAKELKLAIKKLKLSLESIKKDATDAIDDISDSIVSAYS